MKRWIFFIPVAAVLSFVLIVFIWVDSDKRIPRKAFEKYSIYNTSGEGLSLAYRYLSSKSKGVSTLMRPIERAKIKSDAVLFRICPASAIPQSFPSPLKKQKNDIDMPLLNSEEEQWIKRGGRMVLALSGPYASLYAKSAKKEETQKVFPIWPSCNKIAAPYTRIIEGKEMNDIFAIFTAGNGVVVCGKVLGKGELFILSCPEVFQNSHIGVADHLCLLTELAGIGRPIYFDEYIHGMEGKADVVEILGQWGFGPLLIFTMILTGVVFWRYSYRIGPGEDDYRETRTEAIDFIDSLAILYNRALKRYQTLELYRNAFVQSVAAHTGRHGEALERKVGELLTASRFSSMANKKDMNEYEFRRELTILNDAFRRLEDERTWRSSRKAQVTADSTR